MDPATRKEETVAVLDIGCTKIAAGLGRLRKTGIGEILGFWMDGPLPEAEGPRKLVAAGTAILQLLDQLEAETGWIVQTLWLTRSGTIITDPVSTELRELEDFLAAHQITLKEFVPPGVAVAPVMWRETALEQLLLDIGECFTDYAFLRRGEIVASGSVPLAGRLVTDYIAEGLGIPVDTAETLKRAMPDAAGKTTVTVDQLVVEAAQTIFRVVARDLDCRGIGVGKETEIAITGGGSKLRKLAETARGTWNGPVSMTPSGAGIYDTHLSNCPEFAGVFGLLKRALGSL